MQEQQPVESTWNPIVKATFQSLPRIYGQPRKRKSPEPHFPIRSFSSNHRGLTRSPDIPPAVSQPKKPLFQPSDSKLKQLSLPKSLICKKRYCSCHLYHKFDEEHQKVRSKQIGSEKKPRRKLKLLSLNQNKKFYKLDDKESGHKVQMGRGTDLISYSVLSRMSGMIQRNFRQIERTTEQLPRIQNSQNHEQSSFEENNFKTDIRRITTEQIKIQKDVFEAEEKNSEKQPLNEQLFLKQAKDTSQKQQKLIQNEKVSISVQANLSEEMIEQYSEREEEQQNHQQKLLIESRSRAPKPSSLRGKKQKFNKKFLHYKKFIQSQSSDLKNDEDDCQSLIQCLKDSQKPSQKEKSPSKNELLSEQSKQSTPIQVSKFVERGFKRNNTQFEYLNKLQSNLDSSKVSILSNGQFRIPKKQEYSSYLKKYNSMDKKKFNLKNVLQSPLFTIVEEEDGVFFGEYENEQKIGEGLHVTKKKIFEGKYDQNIPIQGSERNIDGIYRGGFMNGKREGYGTYHWNNGEIFEGNWKDGMKNGFGIWRSPKGDYYEGQWKNNRQEGKGKFKHKNSVYNGDFVNFVKEGHGEEIFTNGDRYIGEYKNGKAEGRGKYFWEDGSYYHGDFQNGIRFGNGRLIDQNKVVYEGQFQNDYKHGKGKQIYPSGESFKGTFEYGEKKQAQPQSHSEQNDIQS